MRSLYETDFYAWTQEQADLLLSHHLKPYLQAVLQKAYESGKDLVVTETNLPYKTFPQNCPYTLEEILNDHFYPGEPSKEMEEDF